LDPNTRAANGPPPNAENRRSGLNALNRAQFQSKTVGEAIDALNQCLQLTHQGLLDIGNTLDPRA
jgi:hypothetical protein